MDTLLSKNVFIVDAADQRMKTLIKMINDAGGKAYEMSAEVSADVQAVYVLPPFACFESILAEKVNTGSTVFCRAVTKRAEKLASERGIKVFSYNDDEILVTQNAYLTAEGTLAYIINNTPKALRGLPVLVVGLGRVGKAVTAMLKSNYAKVAVASLPIEEQALGHIMAEESLDLKNIDSYISQFDAIVNTVPKLILKGETLANVAQGTLVVDLASAPGGVDYPAARAWGINAVHYQGVPGHTAPYTAAEYILQSIGRKLM